VRRPSSSAERCGGAQCRKKILGGGAFSVLSSSAYLQRRSIANLESKPKYTLTYFAVPGLAETTRYLFKISDTDFVDSRLPISKQQDGKYIRPEFEELQKKGDFPFNQVPVLEVDGVKIGQSKAIERFVARETGLLSGSNLEIAQIEALGEFFVDVRNAFYKIQYLPEGEEKSKAVQKFYSTELVSHLKTLEKNVDDRGFCKFGKLTLADVQLYALLEGMDKQDEIQKTLKDFPKISSIRANVGSHPKIKKYQSERPKSSI